MTVTNGSSVVSTSLSIRITPAQIYLPLLTRQGLGLLELERHQLVVAIQQIDDGALADWEAAQPELGVHDPSGARHRTMLAVAPSANLGDDIQAERVMEQDPAAFGFRVERLVAAWAVGCGIDLQRQMETHHQRGFATLVFFAQFPAWL